MARTEPNDASGEAGFEVTSTPLRAQLAIEPHPASGCRLIGGDDMDEVTQELRIRDVADDEEFCCSSYECQLETTPTEGSAVGPQYHKADVEEHCICPVFACADCISHVRGVADGCIQVVLSVPDRAALREVMQGLDAVDATVEVEWLVRGDEPEATTEIQVSDITAKQREAVELALDMGYYETPRQADLGTVAGQLGISNSAASQRLNAAETKLVRAFLDS